MSLKSLQDQQMQLVLRRSQAKDLIEQAERELGAVGFAIQQLTAYIDEEAKKVQAKTSEDVLADVLQFPVRDDQAGPVVDRSEVAEEDTSTPELPPENDPENNRTA